MDKIYKQNVYSHAESMWHNKGRVGQNDETCVEVMNQMESVTFEKREYSIELNGEVRGSGQFAIVRKTDNKERIIGTTKDRYRIVQPMEYAFAYDEAVKMPCETLGFLGTDAEKMFITSKLPSIDIHGDEIRLYQFLAMGFDGMYGIHQYVTGIRTICANTWSMSVNDAESTQNHGRGMLYVGKHNQINHMKELIAWLSYVQEQSQQTADITKNLFCKMQESPMTVDEAFGLTKVIYPDPAELPAFYPDSLRNEKQNVIDDKMDKAKEDRDLVMELFQNIGTAIDATAWGLFNSVTEAENHYKPSKKDTSYSILLGNRHNTMEKAMAVIGDWSKNR